MARRKDARKNGKNASSTNATNLGFEATLNEQFTESDNLERAIQGNLRGLGFYGHS